jgi:hypothetical protein
MNGLADFLVQLPPAKRSPLEMLSGGEYGFRYNSPDPKGKGWLGNIGTNDTPITEYSIDIDGKQMPTVTPNQSKGDLFSIVNSATTGRELPKRVIDNAVEFANARAKAGYSAFID